MINIQSRSDFVTCVSTVVYSTVLAGMGVFSFARYDDSFYSSSYAGRLEKSVQPKQGDFSVFDGYYTPPVTSALLLRSCKVSNMFLHAPNFGTMDL